MLNLIDNLVNRWKVRRFLKKAACAEFIIQLGEHWIIMDSLESPRLGCRMAMVSQVDPNGAANCKTWADLSDKRRVSLFAQGLADRNASITPLESIGFPTPTGSVFKWSLNDTYEVIVRHVIPKRRQNGKIGLEHAFFPLHRNSIQQYAPELLDRLPNPPGQHEWRPDTTIGRYAPAQFAVSVLCNEYRVNTRSPEAVNAFLSRIQSGEIASPVLTAWGNPNLCVIEKVIKILSEMERKARKNRIREGTNLPAKKAPGTKQTRLSFER